MKYKLVIIILFFFISFNMFSFSKPHKEITGDVKTGFVKIYGNEPFTFVGFKTQDGEEYRLLADDDVLSLFRQKQGFLIRITGKIEEQNDENTFHFQNLKDGAFKVESWDVIELD